MVCSGKLRIEWPFHQERPHIWNLATPQYQEKCSNSSHRLCFPLPKLGETLNYGRCLIFVPVGIFNRNCSLFKGWFRVSFSIVRSSL
jgi:hypothetical protein